MTDHTTLCITCHTEAALPDSARCAACDGAWKVAREERQRFIDYAREATAQAAAMNAAHPGLDDPDLAERAALDATLDTERARLQREMDEDPLGFIWFGPRDADGKRR
ncbi:hypothetical protein [Mycobacterium sp. E796]|uniref:hypothetical protein n=1 Tax=Mycobacterium sp. E796 TaxID=1834151 RepID=UPI0007FF3AC3|nr:hypothetical protein [Mycobacterium sp. E796]OBI52959.1 hypothetical protein A5706_22945 [Mycobacterium sp. E796]